MNFVTTGSSLAATVTRNAYSTTRHSLDWTRLLLHGRRNTASLIILRRTLANACHTNKVKMDTSTTSASNVAEPFHMRKALVLTKFSRLEFEQRRYPEWNQEELRSSVGMTNRRQQETLIKNDPLPLQLERRGSDYDNLVRHHNAHSMTRDRVLESLQHFGVETRIVNRFEYTSDAIDWADVVFTTGGDGTFLMAASKVNDRSKPVIGINTDPERSVGHLCLPVAYSTDFRRAIEKLQAGDFQWMYRQRLRVIIQGENAHEEPIELHDQQLHHPEYRFFDLEPRTVHEMNHHDNNQSALESRKRTLPVRALNEVFVGESLSSRVSYYEISTDNAPSVKLKSSGLTICTGTGSTSWTYNINKVTTQCVSSLLNIIQDEAHVKLPVDESLVERVTKRFNDSLVFHPAESKMAYTIRDPVVFGVPHLSNISPRGFARGAEVRSRMFDACIVIDGALSYKFNDGARARFELHDEDALKTVLIE